MVAGVAKSRRLLRWLWLAAAAGAIGCGGSSGPNRGTQCSQVLNAVCARLGGDCMLFPSNQIASCVQSGIPSCCGTDCSVSVLSTQADIDACVNDVRAATCAVLDVTAGGTLPTSCQGVVRSALTSAASSPLQSAGPSPGARIGGLVSE